MCGPNTQQRVRSTGWRLSSGGSWATAIGRSAALIASNTPHNLKKVFTGSMAALVLALLAVSCDCIPNPSGCGDSRGCLRAADRLRKNSIPKAGAVRRLLSVWLCAFHWRRPDHDSPTRKRVSASGQSCRCGLVCGVVPGDSGPAVDETEAGDRSGGGSWASGDDQLKTPTLTFADVGGLEEIQEANPGTGPGEPERKKVRRVRRVSKRHPASWPAGDGKNVSGGSGGWRVWAEVLLRVGGGSSSTSMLVKRKVILKRCSRQAKASSPPSCS